jgi:hypothetical protein
MTFAIEDLPNPHLAGFLPEGFLFGPEVKSILAEYRYAYSTEFARLDPFDQAEILPIRQAHLAACHLPADYDALDEAGKRSARFATFSSWYDPKTPNVLVTDTENLIASLYLWNEEYIKPAERNVAKYFYRDPAHKYEMVRAAFGPPKIETEPSKTLITAPRGSTKTVTLIRQAVSMMACVRPHTECLVSEINEDRTNEECTAIQREFEENELIHADFGAKGDLWPLTCRGVKKWNASRMDFCHNGSAILGYSYKSRQRGRHPILWIIDDPEDPERPMGVEERKVFWNLLFRRGLPMLGRGGVFLWISTLILGGCCDRAMAAMMQDDPELKEEMTDARFDDWKLHNFDLLQERPDGQVESIFPDHLSAEAYKAKEASLGKRDALAEYRGQRTAGGAFVFVREQFTHGYMHCRRGMDEYMLDMVTGQTQPWKQFIESLYVGAACDPSNSTHKDADYGAVTVCGVDGRQFPTYWLLDAYLKQDLADRLIWEAYELAGIWRCEKLAFESVAMQSLVVNLAKAYAAKLEEEGLTVPQLVPMISPHQQKSRRIISSLRLLYVHRRIRVPYFGTVTDGNGVKHTSVDNPHKKYFTLLYNQLDYFTDEGASGADDGPDALHMTVRLLRNERGYEKVEEDPNQDQLAKWAEQGVVWSPHQIPLEAWTPEMWAEHSPVGAVQSSEYWGQDGIYD